MTDGPGMLDTLVRHLHASGPVRVWSLIVSILGDISGAQGQVPLPEILSLTARMGIDERAVRTALSRLSRDGLARSDRAEGVTRYGFDTAGRGLFEQAQARIYVSPQALATAQWRLAVLPPVRAADRNRMLDALHAQGAAVAAQGLALWPACQPVEAGQAAVLPFAPMAVPDWMRAAFCTDAAAHAYADIARCAVLPVSRGEERAARVLLLHRWRRTVLRHPPVPAVLAAPDWPFAQAHAAMARSYRTLAARDPDFDAGSRFS